MRHPFFKTVEYPWDRPEAVTLHDVLSRAIPEVSEIDRRYKMCGGGLRPLALSQGPSDLWKEALENLAHAGKLWVLCYGLLADAMFRDNETFREAVRAVVEAQAAGRGGSGAASHESRQESPPDRPGPPRRTWRGVALAVAVGLGLALALTLGLVIGRQWGGSWRGIDPPLRARLPEARVAEPNDRAVRSELSQDEVRFIEQNVDRATTVLIVTVGDWTADVRVDVRVRPAESAPGMKVVYQRSRALLKRHDQTTDYQVTWDTAEGSLSVRGVDGAAGDRLHILVVLPITEASAALLSDPKAIKRFLCVEVSR